MLIIKIESLEMVKDIHKALKGSKCYEETEVALVKDPADEQQYLVIGEPNCDNVLLKISK